MTEEEKQARWARFVASSLKPENEFREPKALGSEPVSKLGTLERILERWATAERTRIAAKTVAGLTFSVQLAPKIEPRTNRPIKWEKRG